MTYTDAVVVLEGMIKALEIHIELGQKGLIQEDCIGCRKKDLETYKGILKVLEKEHNERNGWQRLAIEQHKLLQEASILCPDLKIAK